MKNLILLSFLFLFSAAKCQEPDAYSQEIVDSLNARIDFLESVLNSNELTVIGDTFNFEISDERIKVELNKHGHDVRVDIVDGSKRINADYINYTRQIILMDSTYTVGSMYIR